MVIVLSATIGTEIEVGYGGATIVLDSLFKAVPYDTTLFGEPEITLLIYAFGELLVWRSEI